MPLVATKTEKKTAVSATTARMKGTLGSLIDGIWDLREQKRGLEEQVKAIEAEIAAIEEALQARLEAEGTDKASGKKATVSISKSVVANVIDWEAFHAFIKKTGYFHLLQRRTSDAACRELFDAGKKIAGVEPFEKKRLNVRTIA